MNQTEAARRRVQNKYAHDPEGYDEYRIDDPRGNLLSQRDIRIFNRLVKFLPRNGSILEIGSGTGRFTFPSLSHFEGIVKASDINEGMRMRLAVRADELGVRDRLDICHADIFAIDMPEQSLDCVFALHVIPRLLTYEDQKAALVELSRTLMPGGRLLFNFRNRSSLYGRIVSREDPIATGKGHAMHYSDMISILKDQNMQVLKTAGKHVLARRLLDRLPISVGSSVAKIDEKIDLLGSRTAWDVFVVAQKV